MHLPGYAIIYKQHYSDLVKYARLICDCEIIAEDIVQDVFTKLLYKVPMTEVSNWKAYLLIMVRNEAISHLRKETIQRKVISRYRLRLNHCSSHDPLLEKEYRERLWKAVQQLPTQQSIVFELYCVYNWRCAEVANALDLSPSTVKNHIKVVRKKLSAMVA